MNMTFAHIENVNPVKMVSASAVYGVGLLTAIVFGFCHIFGTECNMYSKKAEKAKLSATNKLIEKARSANAAGIMNVTFQVQSTQVFMYGIAYTEDTNIEYREETIKEDEHIETGWTCKKCGSTNSQGILNCRDCGTYK